MIIKIKEMNITVISEYISAEVYGSLADQEIKWLLTDSRSLSFPAGSLFFAIKTRRNNGHNYIPELYRQQLRHFVVSDLPQNYKEFPDAGIFACARYFTCFATTCGCTPEQFLSACDWYYR